MKARKNIQSSELMTDGTNPILSTAASRRLILIEDIIIGLIMASTLFLFSTKLNSHFTLPKLTVLACLTTALLGAFLVRLRSGDYQVLPKVIRLPLLLLVIWWLLGTSQAIHLQTALEGQYGRYNGLYTNLLLLTVFVTVSSIPFDTARFRRFLSLLQIMVLMICLYAFIQYMGFDTVFKKGAGFRPPSSVGNPVALAAILLITAPYVLAEILLSNKLKKKITAAIILLVLLSVIFITGSRGPWMGLFAGMITAFIALMTVRDSRLSGKIKIMLPVIIVLAVVVMTLISVSGIYNKLSLGVSLEMRLTYFEVAGQMIKDSPLFGYGFESFRLAYPLYRPIADALFYEKTIITPTMIHNDYLQLSADNGIPSAIFYMCLVGGLLWLIVRVIRSDKQYRVLHIATLSMLSGYLAYGLSGWLEAASSIMFWLVLAVSTSFVLQRSGAASIASRSSTYIYTVIMGGAFFVAIGYAVIMTIKVTQDYTLRKAQSYSMVYYNKTDEHLGWLGKSSHDNSYYQDKIGVVYMRRLMKTPMPRTYQLARQYLLRARELNRYDPYIRFHIIETDAVALRSRIIKRPSMEATADMTEILRMDPNNPTVYQVRAGLYAATGNRKAAEQNLARMRQIKNPNK